MWFQVWCINDVINVIKLLKLIINMNIVRITCILWKLQVYKHSTDDIYEYHMFDGDIHIRFDGNVIDDWRFLESLDDEDEYDDYYDSTPYPVILRRHTTKVSLEKAKKTKGFEKLDGFFTHN